MVNSINGAYPPQGWQAGFAPGPNGRFHPMMGMGNMSSMMKAAYPHQYGAQGYNNAAVDNTDDSSPNSQRNARHPGNLQSYDSNYGAVGPMGGPGGMINFPGQFGQAIYQGGDERDNGNGKGGYPPQSYKQFFEGYGPNGMSGNNMMGMGRNFADPMMQMQQNGFGNGGGAPGGGGADFNRRHSSGGYPSSARQMDHPLPPRTPQQQGVMVYPPHHPNEHHAYGGGAGGATKNGKPYM